MIECFAGTWRAWIGRGITTKSGAVEKTVATLHLFKDLPLLQPFVPYGTKFGHAAKMKLPRESCHISKTDVFTRQRLWQAWNKICNSWLPAFDFQDPPACRAGLSR
jgi:hypothetical protein